MPSALAIHQSIGHYTRYAGIAQPNRPESSFVHFTVQDEKSSARGWSCARRRMQEPGSWDGAGQTPGDKQEGCLREIGMPVGKLSAVEHNELAGESACPTHSACTREKSQENVETPAGVSQEWSPHMTLRRHCHSQYGLYLRRQRRRGVRLLEKSGHARLIQPDPALLFAMP